MVKRKGEHYKCSVCGNEVVVTTVGGGSLFCCGQPMVLIDMWPLTAAGMKKPKAKKS